MSWCEIVLKEIIIRVKPHVNLEDILLNIPTSGYHPIFGDFKEFRRLVIKYYNE